MKKFEFETSKGKFLLVDEKDYPVFHVMIETNGFNFYSLKQITENQASEIVSSLVKDEKGNKSYVCTLLLLLNSKGIYLFDNPYENTLSIQSLEGSRNHRKQIEESEQKTFYNPYIFKI